MAMVVPRDTLEDDEFGAAVGAELGDELGTFPNGIKVPVQLPRGSSPRIVAVSSVETMLLTSMGGG